MGSYLFRQLIARTLSQHDRSLAEIAILAKNEAREYMGGGGGVRFVGIARVQVQHQQ